MVNREIRFVTHPKDLDENWDALAKGYYQKRAFLNFLHEYNFCHQRYYELYREGLMVAGTIVYPFRANLLTFSSINLFVNLKIIGLPVSIATVPIIGEATEYEYLLAEIIKMEKGLLLGLNFTRDHLAGKVLNMRTLPTIVIDRAFEDFDDYLKGLRAPYRRRLQRQREKFSSVRTEITTCAALNETHYRLFLDVMDRSTTKLETLSHDLLRNLPENFILTTHYLDGTMLAWHICLLEDRSIFFFMGGLNYELRDRYKSYFNNLISIIQFAYDHHFRRIDLGQTAEIAKMKLGGIEDERRMFLYHKNMFAFLLIKIFKRAFEYSKIQDKIHVFREV